MSIQFFETNLSRVITKCCNGLKRNWSAEMAVAISRPSTFKDNESQFLEQIENWEFQYKFRKKISKNILIKISIIKHFLSKEAQSIITTLVDEQINKFHLDEDITFQMISQNKAEMLIFLENKYRNRMNEFFGWLMQIEKVNGMEISLSNLEQVLPINFWTKKRKPVIPKRKRGYDDHGHLGSEFSKTIKQQSNDYSIRELVLQELNRKHELQNSLDFLRGFLL